MSDQGRMTERGIPAGRPQSLVAAGEGRAAYRLLERLRAGQPAGVARWLLLSQLEELVGTGRPGGVILVRSSRRRLARPAPSGSGRRPGASREGSRPWGHVGSVVRLRSVVRGGSE